MGNLELSRVAKRARKLQLQIDALTADLEALKNTLKSEMEQREVDTLAGDDWKVTYKTVISNRLDTTAIKRELPEVAARYNKQVYSKRFTLS